MWARRKRERETILEAIQTLIAPEIFSCESWRQTQVAKRAKQDSGSLFIARLYSATRAGVKGRQGGDSRGSKFRGWGSERESEEQQQ